jgi:hypothetical protein
MNCKICNSISNEIFKTKVLLKYDVSYFKCTNCQFIQTEKPYWLQEAYKNAITDLDIGLVSRNINNQHLVSKVITDLLNTEGKFIDYGGGYGMFVRLMRDKGFDYYRQDYFCDNLFSKHFDITDLPENTKFELLSAFEVFEHLEDPKAELEKMLKYSDNIIFSTEIQPEKNPTPETWWYFVPETGQHISLYTEKSLKLLGDHFNLYYQGFNGTIHLFTKEKKSFDFNEILKKRFLDKVCDKLNPKNERKSLLKADFEFIKKNLHN